MRIDAHQHFWKFDPVRDSWIDDSMKVIQRDFLPDDLEPVLLKNGFDGCVSVQSDQSPAENMFHLQLADQFGFIKGIVGWVDFQAADIEDQLSAYRKFGKLKGFRHVLQGEKQRDFMLRPAFKRGISHLQRFGYTYDVLIFPDQLAYVLEFVRSFPDQPFVVDHLAKPYIKRGEIVQWRKDITQLAQFNHVYCKVSGMVTEADWSSWRPGDFKPYLDAVTEGFGTERIMFGSDWPVCLVAAGYEDVVDIPTQYYSSFSKDEQQAIFGENAKRFYNL